MRSRLKESKSPDSEQAGGSSAEESLWLRQARAGDPRAFERIYRRHAAAVYALCLRLTADPVRAGILTQDAFVRAWERLDSFREEGPFGAWLRRLTVNCVFQEQRGESRRRRSRAAPLQEQRVLGGETPDGGRTAAPAGLALDLERAIQSLPAAARHIFVLHDVEGYPLREIARISDLALGTVKSQLHRARRLLRTRLDPEAEEAEP